VYASVNLPLHHKVQKFSSGTGASGGSGKRTVKRLCCGSCGVYILPPHFPDEFGLAGSFMVFLQHLF